MRRSDPPRAVTLSVCNAMPCSSLKLSQSVLTVHLNCALTPDACRREAFPLLVVAHFQLPQTNHGYREFCRRPLLTVDGARQGGTADMCTRSTRTAHIPHVQGLVNPKPFLKSLISKPVMVKLKWGMEYKGEPARCTSSKVPVLASRLLPLRRHSGIH